VESFLHFLQTLDPLLIYGALFLIAFLENLFPPSPSDLMVVFGGSLVGMGLAAFVPVLAATTVGSAAGFLVMYQVGAWFGTRLKGGHLPRFFPVESLKKVESWFQRYGYGIIVANRFMAGTRAVVSFFAGMSHLRLLPIMVLSVLSAAVWNTLLVLAGYLLGQNWRHISGYLGTYSGVVTGLLVLAAAVLLLRHHLRRRRRKRAEAE
jgi:membrane protein DedA with SNARE-associated domain